MNCNTNEINFSLERSLSTRIMIIGEAFHSDFCVIWEYSSVHFSKSTLANYIAFAETFSCDLEFAQRKPSYLSKRNFALIFTCKIYRILLSSRWSFENVSYVLYKTEERYFLLGLIMSCWNSNLTEKKEGKST